MHTVPVYETNQIRTLEQRAMDQFNVDGQLMMQRAGHAAFLRLLQSWPNAKHIAVVCGGGNNGGDGYVLAKLAHDHGLKVSVWQTSDNKHASSAAQSALTACKTANIDIQTYSSVDNLQHADVIVDAICGIGLKDAPNERISTVISAINSLDIPVLAIDIPTGVNADSGHVAGEAVLATVTVTYIGLKLGLLTGKGIACAGEVFLDDLQLPIGVFEGVQPVVGKLALNQFGQYLKPRTRDWHKGKSGHLLIVGSDIGYAGAARMAAMAALRCGAGLVTVATHVSNAAMMNSCCPEVMCHGISESAMLEPLIEKASGIVLGPGLGRSAWSQQMMSRVLSTNKPLLIDADGLNLLAGSPARAENRVLTPHPGEAARLLKTDVASIQADRLRAVQEIHRQYGGVCVLKGAGTLVAVKDQLPAVCDLGNPGMATAGMGDVLSGVIGSLLVQGVPLYDAACLGVLLHAMAGDRAAASGARGMLATDLLPFLRQLINRL